MAKGGGGAVRLAHKAHSLLFRISRQLQMADAMKKTDTLRCCRMLHVRTLAIVIALCETVFLVYQGLVAISYVFSAATSHHALSAVVYSLAVLVACVAIALLFIGIFCHIPVLLVPHMLMQVLFVLTLLGMASFAVYAVVAGTSLQLRIAVVGIEDELSTQRLSEVSPLKLSMVSGFLTGLLVLVVVSYFCAALINAGRIHLAMVTNVYVSAVTQDNISRHELLAWVNSCLKANFSKIEEMSTGAAYCQLTHMLFPDSINLRKVKWNSRNEMDHLNNWKILGNAWKTLGVDKPVAVERLTKAKFQDNFEFLQWFFKFFNANFVEESEEYDAVAARGGEPLPAGAKGPAPSRVPPARTVTNTTLRSTTNTTGRAPAPAAAPAQPKKPSPAPSLSNRSAAPAGGDASALKELQEENARLSQQNEEMAGIAETLETERNFYFEKLRRIEDMCNACPEDENPDKNAILTILYETNEAGAEEDGAVHHTAAADDDDETF